MTIHTLTVFGTRPEAIKMAPVIQQLALLPNIQNKICITGQHQQMLNSVLEFFDIQADYNLEVMTDNQDLTGLTVKLLVGMQSIFQEYRPDLVIVHGDTTTTFVASLAAFYHQIPVAHVEAGLRTHHIYSPWPEEVNRHVTSVLAAIHFAPTERAKANLLREGVAPDRVHVTGNTVIDALYMMNQRIDADPVMQESLQHRFAFLSPNRRMILVTGHRRENFGEGFERICRALSQIAQRFPLVDIVYPVHLNPNVQEPVNRLLGDQSNIHLIPPVDYLPFVYLMKSAFLILTDSGGIQEEAPALGIPVLVMRDITERPEAVAAGGVKMVGSAVEKIVEHVEMLLMDELVYKAMSQPVSPYGEGDAAGKIAALIAAMSFSLSPARSARVSEEVI